MVPSPKIVPLAMLRDSLLGHHLWIAYVGCALAICAASRPAEASDGLLPYSNRTHSYSGFSTTVQGNITGVGMAGALVGVANSILSAGDNPAGLAMTLGSSLSVQATGTSVHDDQIQDFEQMLSTSTIGIASTEYPWAFSLASWSPATEGQNYLIQGPLMPVEPRFRVREIRATVSRVFLDKRLSLGASAMLGWATQEIGFPGTSLPLQDQRTYDFGVSLGALYQMPHRILLGASYTPGITYDSGRGAETTPGINHYFQPVVAPWRLAVGTGWLPNRLFQAGFGLYFLGSTPHAALLADDSRLVGQHLTVQPRLGANYTWLEYKNFKSEVSLGTYFETSRLEGAANRLHTTAALTFDLWFFNLGWGLDRAPGFRDYNVSVGVDVLRLLKRAELVPEGWKPPQAGLFSDPFEESDVDMSRALSRHWEDHPQPDILEVGREFPVRLENKLKELTEAIDHLDIPGAHKRPGSEEESDSTSHRRHKRVRHRSKRKKHTEKPLQPPAASSPSPAQSPTPILSPAPGP